MKHFRTYFIIAMAVAAVGCARYKVIPDETLKDIFKDIYLTNAYVGTKGLDLDSLEIYNPIFKKYKYNIRDFRYTIDNFSRRKSSKLSDIIEGTINELDSEYKYYEWRVAVLDTIQAVSDRTFSAVVYEDSLIRVNRIADTARLRVTLPVEEGRYVVDYTYMIDSTDKNNSLRTTFNLVDSAGKSRVANTQWLRNNARKKETATIEAKPEHRQLVILFANYKADMKKPAIRIDSLSVRHFLPKEAALERMTRSLLDYRLIVNGQEWMYATQDSLSLAVDPPGIVERGDSIP